MLANPVIAADETPDSEHAPAGVRRETMIPHLLRAHPRARAVFDRYGLRGCGGRHGPAESVGFFARTHGVDEPRLLRELRKVIDAPENPSPRQPRPADDLPVGINTAILSDRAQASNMGIGFAVPINLVRELVPQLRTGKVTRGMIGVTIAPVGAEAYEDLGLTSRAGAFVSAVTAGGPAARAGVKALDVIVEFNGKAVKNRDQLVDMVTRTKPGTTVPVKVLRDGKNTSVNVTIGELDLEAEGGPAEEESTIEESAGFGIGLDDITPEVARRLELPRSTTGAIVTEIDPGSPAAEGGLRRFDVITQVNGQPVASAADASKKLQAIGSGRLARILVMRGGQELGFAIRKE